MVRELDRLPVRSKSFCGDNTGHLIYGIVKVFPAIDDYVVIVRQLLHLEACVADASLQLRLRFGVTGLESLNELFHGRRGNEHEHSLREPSTNLNGSLNVDLE
jgi:hypothetical protein